MFVEKPATDDASRRPRSHRDTRSLGKHAAVKQRMKAQQQQKQGQTPSPSQKRFRTVLSIETADATASPSLAEPEPHTEPLRVAVTVDEDDNQGAALPTSTPVLGNSAPSDLFRDVEAALHTDCDIHVSLDDEPEVASQTRDGSYWAMFGDTPERWTGIDMTEEVAMSLLDTSLISVSTKEPEEDDYDGKDSHGDDAPATVNKTITAATDTTPLHFWKTWRSQPVTPALVRIQSPSFTAEDATPDDPERHFRNVDSEQPLYAADRVAFTTFRQNSTQIALQESKTYLDRIAQLEEALANAEYERDCETQRRIEAESTVSVLQSPSSSVPNHPAPIPKAMLHPPVPSTPSSLPDVESLWERNKTLVKEVRFADQTCMELSSEKTALEQRIEHLSENITRLDQENTLLREQLGRAEETVRQVKTDTETDNAASPSDKDRTRRALEEFPRPIDRKEGMGPSLGEHIANMASREPSTMENPSDRCHTAQSENPSLRERLEVTLEERTAALRQCESLSARVSELEALEGRHHRDLETTAARYDDLFRQLEEAHQKLTVANQTIVEGDECRELLQRRLTSDAQRTDELEQSRLLLQKANDDVALWRTKFADGEGEIRCLEGRIRELTSSGHDSSRAAGLLRKELGKVAEEKRELLVELEAANEKLAVCETKLEQFEKDGQELEATRSELDALRNEETLRNEQHTERERQFSSKLADTLSRIETLELDAAPAIKQKDEQSQELDAALGQLDCLRREIDDLKEARLSDENLFQQKLSRASCDLEVAHTDIAVARDAWRQKESELLWAVQKVVAQTESQATILEERLVNRHGELVARMGQAVEAVSYVRESIIFGDSTTAVDTVSAAHGLAESAPATPLPSDGALDATFDNPGGASTDLELMEEARLHGFAESYGVHETEFDFTVSLPLDTDTMSSIAGISHLFSLSPVSIDQSPMENTHNTTTLLRPRGKELQSPRRRINELICRTSELEEQKEIALQDVIVLQQRVEELESELHAMAKDLSLACKERNAVAKISNFHNGCIEATLKENDTNLCQVGKTDSDTTASAVSIHVNEVIESIFSRKGETFISESEVVDKVSRSERDIEGLGLDRSILDQRLTTTNDKKGEIAVALVADNEQIDDNTSEIVSLRLHCGSLSSDTDKVVVLRRLEDLEAKRDSMRDSFSSIQDLPKRNERKFFESRFESMTNDCAKAKERIEELEALLGEKTKQCQELEAHIATIQESYADAKVEKQIIQESMEISLSQKIAESQQAAQIRISASEEQLAIARDEIALLHSLHKSVTSEKKESATKIASLQEASSKQLTELKKANESLDIIGQERDDLLKSLSKLQFENADANSEMEKHQEALFETQESLTECQLKLSVLDAITTERDSLLNKITELELECTGLKTTITESSATERKSLEHTLSSLEEIQVERKSLLENLDSAKIENGLVRKQLDSIKAELEDDKRTSAKLRELYEQQVEANAELRREVFRCKGLVDDSDFAMQDLKEKYLECNEKLANFCFLHNSNEESKLMYDRARESAEGLAIESQRHLAKAREDLETALSENGKMQAEYEKSQEVLSDVRRELAERKEAIKDLEVSREAAIMGLAEYKEQLNSLEISLDKRTQTVNQLQADVKERDDALSKLDQHNAEINVWEKRIQESNDALSRLQDQLDESTASLRTMTNEFKMASTRSDHLELKCSRLRDYIRKVTGKCDQWEDFYDRQAEVVEGLKRANERTRQKTAELARRYQERDQIHDKERAVWTAQKCNLDFIHSQLEEELHGIANELAHVESRPVSS